MVDSDVARKGKEKAQKERTSVSEILTNISACIPREQQPLYLFIMALFGGRHLKQVSITHLSLSCRGVRFKIA